MPSTSRRPRTTSTSAICVDVEQVVQLQVQRLERMVRRVAEVRELPLLRRRRSATAGCGGRAARSPRRTPPPPSAPRTPGWCRRAGAGCVAWAGPSPPIGSAPPRCTVIPGDSRAVRCSGANAPPLLFDRLLDDAAMFPPGNADAATGARRAPRLPRRGPGRVRRTAPRAMPTAGSSSRPLMQQRARPALDVVVIGHGRTPPDRPWRAASSASSSRSPTFRSLRAEPGCPIACEIRADDAGHRVLEAIASAAGDYVGKFRTGGTTAEAFPTRRRSPRVVVDAVRVGAPMKFTAGLHHAVRLPRRAARDSSTTASST